MDGLIQDGPPACQPEKHNCGNYAVAVVYLISYLVISFLVIVNMYIAVILENFGQAMEDVQQGLTQVSKRMTLQLNKNTVKFIGHDPKKHSAETGNPHSSHSMSRVCRHS
ncbi:unnamed protein product [Protopolystoma xenopodis]|uniref:Ion transport domain-containing protein n=1 Tax=Protopolystoma xenopodis TaxID=117903 RepID=A0A3S5B8D0_9PLAT|nr:unnamed protein product [Protopolystoma xenopodis]